MDKLSVFKKKFIFLVMSPITFLGAYHQKDDLSLEASIKRMSPLAQVQVEGESASGPAKPTIETALEPGLAVYKKYCHVCHQAGIAGAPKTGNKDQWSSRYAQGWPTLMKHALQGYKGMPAKGHCMKCSEQDIHEAISYMLKQSQLDPN